MVYMMCSKAVDLIRTSMVAADVQTLTVPLVAGFLLQVLLGAMSYLLPVTMRGGPRALKASLHQMSRFAVVRVVAYNLVVALFVLVEIGSPVADARSEERRVGKEGRTRGVARKC